MVHKLWKTTDEKVLIEEFRKAGCNPSAIPVLAKRFNRSPDAVREKLKRLGLNVVGAKFQLTTTFEIPKILPSLEEVLLLLARALKKGCRTGFGRLIREPFGSGEF